MPGKIPREKLLNEIRRLADELNDTPMKTDMEDHGEYSSRPYYNEFGSWGDALEAAGIETQRSTPGREELLDEIRRLADELEPTPTTTNVREHGKYPLSKYYNEFDAWSDAVEAAGLKPGTQGNKISREELINELQRLADELNGHPLSTTQMTKHGKYSFLPYQEEFGSWTDALEAAGLESRSPQGGYESGVLIEDLQNAAEHVDGYMTMDQYDEHGDYSSSTILRKFGSWTDPIEAAGLPSDPRRDRPPEYTGEELLDKLRELANELGQSPTFGDMNERDDYPSAGVYIQRFGSWNAAKEQAGIDPGKQRNKISREELINELQRLADELDRTPTTTDMEEHGKYSLTAYYNQFVSWNAAKEQARLLTQESNQI